MAPRASKGSFKLYVSKKGPRRLLQVVFDNKNHAQIVKNNMKYMKTNFNRAPSEIMKVYTQEVKAAFLEAMNKLNLAKLDDHVGFSTHDYAAFVPSDPNGLTFMIGSENKEKTNMDAHTRAVVWPTDEGFAIGRVQRVPENAKGRIATRHTPTESLGCCEVALAVKDAVARGAAEAVEECRVVFDKTVDAASEALEDAVAGLGLAPPPPLPPNVARQLTFMPTLDGMGKDGPFPLPPPVRRQNACFLTEF